MKKFLFSLLFLAISLVVFSQKTTYSLSSIADVEYSDIGRIKVANGYIGYERKEDQIDIIQSDSLMNEQKRIQLPGDWKKYNSKFAKLFTLINTSDKVFFIYRYTGGKDEGFNIKAMEINPFTLQVGIPKIISTITPPDYKIRFMNVKYYNNIMRVSNLITTSPDKGKVLLLLPGVDNHYFISVFDASMNSLWTKEAIINKADNAAIRTACIDNDANVFLAYKTFTVEKGERPGKEYISMYSQKGGVHDYQLDLGSDIVNQVILLPTSKNNNIYVAGTYGQDELNNITGVFSGQLNISSPKFGGVVKKAFPDKIIDLFAKDNWGSTKPKKYGLDNGLMLQALEMEDGTINLCGDIFNLGGFTSGGGYRINGSILNVHFGITDTIFSYIPKYKVRNTNVDEGSMGATQYAFPYKDKILVFYNEYPKNLEKGSSLPAEPSNDYDKVALVVAILNPDGTYTRQIVIDLSKDNYFGVIENSIKIKTNSLVIPMQKIGKGGAYYKKGLQWGFIKMD